MKKAGNYRTQSLEELDYPMPPSSDPAAPLVVNAPLVVGETVDDETIIMHHGSGRYFDITGSGTLVWRGVEQGGTASQIAAAFAHAYRLSPNEAAEATGTFLKTLAAHDLIRRGNAAAPPALKLAPAPPPYAPPTLGVHDDLADMLLLDPIHDVDAVGWPAPRPADPET
jgi:hypothetical protein